MGKANGWQGMHLEGFCDPYSAGSHFLFLVSQMGAFGAMARVSEPSNASNPSKLTKAISASKVKPSIILSMCLCHLVTFQLKYPGWVGARVLFEGSAIA